MTGISVSEEDLTQKRGSLGEKIREFGEKIEDFLLDCYLLGFVLPVFAVAITILGIIGMIVDLISKPQKIRRKE